MLDGCKWSHDWLECLDCKYLSLPLCPLEGDDAVDKIANRIRAMESLHNNGLEADLSPEELNESQKEVPIFVKVMYHDNTFDMVAPRHLAQLIVSRGIKKFRRSDGWVTIGVDPIRGQGGTYNGPDRRRNS